MTEIPKPPTVPVVGEYPAIVEPGLRDMPEFRGIEVSESRPVEVELADEREWADLTRRAHEVAFADERVREALEGRRHSVIGLSRREDKRERRHTLALVAYSYDDGLTYEVLLGTEDDLAVSGIVAVQVQPAPSDEEVETAIRLARGDRRVEHHLEADFDAHALLTSDVAPGDEHYGRRRFSVVFGYPDDRLPRVHAVVDLGSEELVWVHCRAGEQR
ncbi:MAG: hypothetical protein ACRDQ7_17255 [Haloechinothrix sp.]